MSTLFKVSIFVFILCTIGCNNNTNPVEMSSETEELQAPEISRSLPNSHPRVFASRRWLNNVKEFGWFDNPPSFFTLYSDDCKNIGHGKYIWRHSSVNNTVYVRKNSSWHARGGYVGGVLDMDAVRTTFRENCYLISDLTRELYHSNGFFSFERIYSLVGQGFRRVDAVEHEGLAHLALIGTDGHLYQAIFDVIFLESLRKSDFPLNYKDVSINVDLNGEVKVYAIDSQGELCWGDVHGMAPFPVTITNCRFVDVDRDSRIWIVKNTGSVYMWNSYSFVKVASNLAWDISADNN